MNQERKLAELLVTLQSDLPGIVMRQSEPGRDTVAGVSPVVVIMPETADAVAQVLRIANEQRLAVLPRGRGVQLALGNPPVDGIIVLDVSRLNDLITHAPHDMTVTVGAGMSLAALQLQLAASGQWLALDPALSPDVTIGGIIATNVSGAHRLRYGGVRDQLLGVEVALADGTLARSGGRVVKNVAGYDLPKLFTGSLGTLGIITTATFRLYPLPPAVRRITFTASDLAALHDLALRILQSNLVPGILDITRGDATTATLTTQFEMTSAGIAEQTSEALDLAENLRASAAITDDTPQSVWRDVITPSSDLMFTGANIILNASLVPTAVLPWLQAVERVAAQHALSLHWRAHAGHGIVRAAISSKDGANISDLVPVITELRAIAQESGGSLVIQAAPAALTRQIDVWGATPAIDLIRRVKDQFDPKHILNPGRFVGGI